jgi:hypothetical protein
LIHSKEEEEQIEQLEETLPNLIKEQTAIQKVKEKDKKRGPTSWQETTSRSTSMGAAKESNRYPKRGHLGPKIFMIT